MEVLSVSDLETPLKENGAAPSAVMNALPSIKAVNMVPDAAAQIAAASKEWSGNNGMRKSRECDLVGSQNVLVKKKRPLALLSKDEEHSVRDDTPKHDVVSFAEWKDRKKHKGPKKGFSLQND